MRKRLLTPYAFIYVFALFLIASCSSPKQAFYFKPAPPMPKAAPKPANPEPVYTASTDATPVEIPVTPATEVPNTKTLTKKEVRKLVKQVVKTLRDSVNTKNKEKTITVRADRERLNQIREEMREIKNSVKVEDNGKQTVVSVKKPTPNLNQTEWILLGIAGLLVLLILLSLPVIGNILGVLLVLALIAIAVALLTGYIKIDGLN